MAKSVNKTIHITVDGKVFSLSKKIEKQNIKRVIVVGFDGSVHTHLL